MKLLNKINENNEIKIMRLPFGDACPRITLNSLNNEIFTVFKKIIILLETAHIDEEMIKTNIIEDTQLNDVLDEVEGSKIENRFVIIFMFFLALSLPLYL